MPPTATPGSAGEPSRALRVYERLRSDVLRGRFAPEEALRPQALADELGVSLAVVRESLLRLVGEGLAVRLHNRGFAVPPASAERWQEVAEARAAIEPNTLRLAVERGDLTWEAGVRAAHHRLSRTPARDAGEDGGTAMSEAWAAAHHDFHRALLAGCGNTVLLDSFERLWVASELSRRWSVAATPERDIAGEHAELERAALARDGDAAAAALARHLGATVAALTRVAPDQPADRSAAGGSR